MCICCISLKVLILKMTIRFTEDICVRTSRLCSSRLFIIQQVAARRSNKANSYCLLPTQDDSIMVTNYVVNYATLTLTSKTRKYDHCECIAT